MPEPKPRFGEKGFGGRQPGARNKRTIEKEIYEARIYQRQLADSRKPGGEPLAKEMIAKFAIAFANIAVYFQPNLVDKDGNLPPGVEDNPHGDFKEFRAWGMDTVSILADLAPYQSPTFKAVAVQVGAINQETGPTNAADKFVRLLRNVADAKDFSGPDGSGGIE